MSEINKGQLRFHLQNLDLDRDSATVQNLAHEALNAAIKAAGGKEDIDAKLEAQGNFLGVGETVVVLWILHALKVGGVAFGTGVAGAAGKDFYERFLAPELRKRIFCRINCKSSLPARKQKNRNCTSRSSLRSSQLEPNCTNYLRVALSGSDRESAVRRASYIG